MAWGGGKISNLINRLIRLYYHCEIPPCVNVSSCYFNHSGFGIVINPKVIMGNNVDIQHMVTIGTKRGSDIAPVIEDNVIIGAKATIIGSIKIGQGSVIGAGSVVVKDVPPYSVVAGNPARIIKTLKK